jgi:thermitase
MSHQCPFPVRATDTRRCYRTGSVPGFTLSLTLVAILSGYAGLSEAAPAPQASAKASGAVPEFPVSTGSIVGWAKGRLLVAPRAGLSDKEFERALKPQNAKSKGRFKQANIHVIELPAGTDEVAAMQALKKDKRFKYVELDYAMAPAASVNDPNIAKSWPLPKIQANTAWDTSNGSGVIIAILDSGLDASHPDLKANYVPGWNFYDNNSNTTDGRGHGTAVAGTAAMVANNSTGSAGVAYGAKIMPVRISSLDGIAYGSTMAQALYWAADNGARVANISFSGVPGNSTVQSAAQYMRSKGGYVVASAGNSGGLENVAAHDSILAVSATDQNDARPSWSSYGPYVDVSAPGVSVYSTTVGGGFGNYSGTSFSSPIVAATAALVMAANNKLTPADIDRILTSTATDLGTSGYDQYFGHGRVDAARAVAAARTYVASDTQAPTISIATPTGGTVTGVVAVDVKYSDNVGVSRAELYLNGSMIASDSTSPFAFAWDTAGYADGSYSLVAKAYDAAGNVGASPSVSVTLGNDTVAPSISSFSLTSGMTVASNQKISASATDNQRVAKMSLEIDSKVVATTTGSSISYTWNTRKVAKGSYSVTVRAWDAASNATSKTVTVYK